jgi:hypothetical protein
MPAREVPAAAKAHNPHFKVDMVPPAQFELLPGVEFVERAVVAHQESTNPEKLEIRFTMPPSKEVVWFVSRFVQYYPDKPTVANVIAALREKYGKESGSISPPGVPAMQKVELVDAFWVFDAKGQKVPPAVAAEVGKWCVGQNKEYLSLLQQPPSPSLWNGNGGRVFCGEHTIIKASWGVTGAGAGEAPGLAHALQVEAVDLGRYHAAFEASQAMLQQAAGKKLDADQQKAAKVKPKL